MVYVCMNPHACVYTCVCACVRVRVGAGVCILPAWNLTVCISSCAEVAVVSS